MGGQGWTRTSCRLYGKTASSRSNSSYLSRLVKLLTAMTKQSFAHTCQVSYAYALDGDTDLDCKPIGWSVRSVYRLCSESEDEAVVYDRDNI